MTQAEANRAVTLSTAILDVIDAAEGELPNRRVVMTALQLVVHAVTGEAAVMVIPVDEETRH